MGLDRLVESLKRSKASGKSSSIVVIAEGEKQETALLKKRVF
jgi:6-phosphofructokinase 1